MTNLNFPKRIKIGFLPTPIHKLENLSKILKRNIYIKRDDLTGFAFGGNKIRKLEFLLADAKEKKADVILTCGALQSNHCRLTSALSSRLGFEVYLILLGKKPKKFTGNLLLDKILGANLHFINTKNWNELETKTLEISEKLKKEDKRIYPIPFGGSTPLGTLGHVSAIKEIKDQSKKNGIEFSHIFLASSSGGTQAGLVVGKKIFNLNSEIIGIGVSKTEKEVKRKVLKIAEGTAKLLKLKNFSISMKEIKVDQSYIGKGYGMKIREAEEAIEILAREESIFLDHVYTGKAMAGLIDYARKGRFSKDDNVLFIHTGGNVELFA